jgi:hypothetical protein
VTDAELDEIAKRWTGFDVWEDVGGERPATADVPVALLADVPALVAALREARGALREVALIAQDVAERNHASARWRMGEVARAALARVLGAATASPRRA